VKGALSDEPVFITGSDANHIFSVLRMKAGEKAVLCSEDSFEYPAEIISAAKNCVEFKILAKRENNCEPKIHLRLFQCVPKSEKLDFIVQKSTELGVSEIIPVISKRCISRPKNDSNKIPRLQNIAEAAAKQSGRGKIPLVHEFTSFNAALKLFKSENLGIIFYENGGERLNNIIKKRSDAATADIFIGSEGGFEFAEIEAAKAAGLIPASLGRLILRTETAPVAAIAILMNLLGEI
jgi:16S rRNA (uracil1498-N3)-methyltransferase